MTTGQECAYEQDVLDALASRRWPARCDPELRAHVASCAACADLALVAGSLLDDSLEEARPDLPPASLAWWRAQLRARQEGARAALRPIRIAQLTALACVGVVLVAALNALAPAAAEGIPSGVARLASAVPQIDPEAAGAAAVASFANRGVQLAAAAWLILGPVAVYLAFSRE